MVGAILRLSCIGFNFGSSSDLELSFVELSVYVLLDELGQWFITVLVLDLDVKVGQPDHIVPRRLQVEVSGDVEAGWSSEG